ncbi:MAG TPA: hypothetical protein VMV44_04025 [Rectinemataceae bacterium]|nr:hypothetical protein [Rectinemataceae bacterium]
MKQSILASLLVVVLSLPLGAQHMLTLSSFGDPADPAISPIARWATAAFKDVGYDLVLEFKPGERALRDANDGLDDGDISRVAGIEKDYPNLIRVPEPLIVVCQIAYAKRGIMAGSLEDLARLGLSVEVLVGNKVMDSMVKPKIDSLLYHEAPDLSQAFSALAAGRVDVLVVSDIQARSWLARPKYASIHPIFVLSTVTDYTYLNKKWADIVPAIAASYKKFKN